MCFGPSFPAFIFFFSSGFSRVSSPHRFLELSQICLWWGWGFQSLVSQEDQGQWLPEKTHFHINVSELMMPLLFLSRGPSVQNTSLCLLMDNQTAVHCPLILSFNHLSFHVTPRVLRRYPISSALTLSFCPSINVNVSLPHVKVSITTLLCRLFFTFELTFL